MGKVRLFIMTEKGYRVLVGLTNRFGSEYIDSVVSSSDPSVQTDFYLEIAEYARAHEIKFWNRKDQIDETPVELMLAISWRWIIKPRFKTFLIIFHDSLLPAYRGFNPLVSSLINGDSHIGVTAICGSEEYDRGQIIAQKSNEISYPIKIMTAISIVSKICVDLAIEILSKIDRNEHLNLVEQDESFASYSLWRDELDYHIDWNKDSSEIKRFIDSVGAPYRGAFSYVNGSKVRVLDSTDLEDVRVVNRDPGKVLFKKDNMPVVVCAKGLLQLLNITDDCGNEFNVDGFRIRFY